MKTIVVLGASNLLATRLIRELLAMGFAVTALTKHPELCHSIHGAHIVPCTALDKHLLSSACTKAHGIFMMNPFWDPRPELDRTEEEEAVYRLVFDVAKLQGVKHVIWCALTDAHHVSDQVFRIPHFLARTRLDDYWMNKQSDVGVSIIYPGFFYQNLYKYLPIRVSTDGTTAVLTGPLEEFDAIPCVSLADIGKLAAHMFNNPERYLFKRIVACSEMLSMYQILQSFNAHSTVPAKYNRIQWDDFFKYCESPELCDTLKWFDNFSAHGLDLNEARTSCDMKTLEQWLPTKMRHFMTSKISGK